MTRYQDYTREQLSEFWSATRTWQRTSGIEYAQGLVGQRLYKTAMRMETALGGLKRSQMTIEGFHLAWLENARPLKNRPTLLMIHGLGGDKNNWLRFARYFTPHYNMIIPDLPAHGESNYIPDQSYRMNAQARRIFKLLDYLGLNKVHILGHSMGGLLAAKMVFANESRFLSLGLMANVGLISRSPSPLELCLDQGDNPFLVHSVPSYQRFLGMATFKPVFIPQMIKVALARDSYRKRKGILHCFADLLPEIFERQTFGQKLPDVTIPIFVLWGEQDKLSDIDIMHQIKEVKPQAQTVILQRTGHLPMMEKPRVSAKSYASFLEALPPLVISA